MRLDMYTNADQLLNKIDELLMFIVSDEADIMMFPEVIPKAQRNPIAHAHLTIKGYEMYINFNHTEENLGGSGIRGVALYVKSELITKELKLESQFRDEVWVEISLRNKYSLLCGCVYRSPTGDMNSAIESTKGVRKMILDSILRGNSHLRICGDLTTQILIVEMSL